MDIIEFEGLKFTPLRDLDGTILRLVPLTPATGVPTKMQLLEDSQDAHSEECDSEETNDGEIHEVEDLIDFDYDDLVDSVQDELPLSLSPGPSLYEEDLMERREMLSRSTFEIDEPVSTTDEGSDSPLSETESVESDAPKLEKAESVSSVCSDSFGVSRDQHFPILPQNKTSAGCAANKNFEQVTVDVCYKPTFRTLKKLQMRDGPGANFGPVAIIPADTEIRVIAEGLAECTTENLKRWWNLHVKDENEERKDKAAEQIADRSDDWKTWARKMGYSRKSHLDSIFKQAHAASRKVKIAVEVDGEEKFGWISKRKNSGPTIKRSYGYDLPTVRVDDLDSSFCGFGLSKDLQNFRDANNNRFPRKNFYSKMLKEATGCDVVRWEARWVPNRNLGMETKTLANGRLQTGYHKPESTAFLVYNSLQKAKTFIKNANKKLGARVNADFAWDFANMAPVPASQCPVEWHCYEQKMNQLKHENDDIKENKAKEYAGIFTVHAF